MKIYKLSILGFCAMGAVACTSLSEGEGVMPPNPDFNRRVVYSTGGVNENIRRQMYEQSSDVNRKRNIEEVHSNGPATTPQNLRPRQLPDAPVDSTRHNVTIPIRSRVRVGN